MHYCELDRFPILKAISDGIDGENIKCNFQILYKETCITQTSVYQCMML